MRDLFEVLERDFDLSFTQPDGSTIRKPVTAKSWLEAIFKASILATLQSASSCTLELRRMFP